MKRPIAIAAVVVAAAAVGLALGAPWRDLLGTARDVVAWQVQAGQPDHADAMIAMPDGVRLATDVYLPGETGRRPTVLMRLPYGKRSYGEVRFWVDQLTRRGFAVVAQDMRGRHASEGVFAPYPNAGRDGAATLDWIVAQPWSNGRVGTLGCSALGEAQLMLAAQGHPAHRAMVPIAAGGAIGSAGGNRDYFSVFEGGIFALATGAGWFGAQGGKTPARSGPHPIDPASTLDHLPIIDIVRQMRPDPTDYEAFLRNFDVPGYWRDAGYVTGKERFATPSLLVDTWHDPGIRSTLDLAETLARGGAPVSTIIAAGTHCGYLGSDGDTVVGDLAVSPETTFGFVDAIVGFFDHHLADGPAPQLPPLSYYSLVEDRWRSATRWPPQAATLTRLYLTGDAALSPARPTGPAAPRRLRSDPADPVPSIGGALCCTGDPEARSGPVFQNAIEGRDDLLLYSSEPLRAPLLVAGPIRARLRISADVPDTDVVLRLTDVDPEGRSLLVQEGALRLRYRDGFDRPRLMKPGEIYDVTIEIRDIAYLFRAGHRLRLHVAGSSFPRLARNLNTGGTNHSETAMTVANIAVHSDTAQASELILYALPD